MERQRKSKPLSWNFAKLAFKVLYSPMRAFEEIVSKPTVKGPIFILIMMLPFVIGGQYVSNMKLFLEVPSPENDLWTEKPSASSIFLWISNDNITFDNKDYVNGNYSVSSSINGSSQIWARLTQISSFNCSEKEYGRLSFSIKWINTMNVTPTAILQLLSSYDESNRFELNITSLIADGTNDWANVSIDLNSDSWEAPIGSPIIENITGVSFYLNWINSGNLTMKIDDLFFGKYHPFSSLEGFELLLIYSGMRSSVKLLLEWIVLSGVILLALKSFSNWKGSWRNLFAVIGNVYSSFIVHFAALILLFLLLPPFFFPQNLTSEIFELYQNSWFWPISILTLVFYVWAAVLCIFALKNVHELSWSKAIMIALASVFLSAFWGSFLLNILF